MKKCYHLELHRYQPLTTVKRSYMRTSTYYLRLVAFAVLMPSFCTGQQLSELRRFTYEKLSPEGKWKIAEKTPPLPVTPGPHIFYKLGYVDRYPAPELASLSFKADTSKLLRVGNDYVIPFYCANIGEYCSSVIHVYTSQKLRKRWFRDTARVTNRNLHRQFNELSLTMGFEAFDEWTPYLVYLPEEYKMDDDIYISFVLQNAENGAVLYFPSEIPEHDY